MILCRFKIHIYRKIQRAGTVKQCRFCPHEKRLTWATIPNPDFAGRQLTRAKTRGQR